MAVDDGDWHGHLTILHSHRICHQHCAFTQHVKPAAATPGLLDDQPTIGLI